LIEGDIQKLIAKCGKDVDYVLHQAALGSVPRSINDPVATKCFGFFEYAAKDAKVKRLFMPSSSTWRFSGIAKGRGCDRKATLSLRDNRNM
jgi:UDP-N-acetylglucosamine 4-epimerase